MRKHSRTLALVMATTMVFALCLTGCGNSGAATPAETDSATPADDTVYELSLSMHDPVTTPQAVYMQAWCDDVAAATDNHVLITIYGSSTLAAAADVGDMVESGGADIGWIYTGYYSGQYPLSDVITLPMQGFGDPVISTNVLWDLYDSSDAMQAEWSTYQLLMLYGNPGMILCSGDKPITSQADLSGRTMRCPAGAITDVLTAWGANPITMAPGDVYQAMEKNNISGYIFEPSGITNFSLQEVTKYYTDYPMYDGPFALVMNTDKFASLPAEYQEAIMGLSGKAASLNAAEAFETAVAAARDTITAAGGEFVQLDASGIIDMQTAADAYAETWAKGIDGGADFLAQAKDLAVQYGK